MAIVQLCEKASVLDIFYQLYLFTQSGLFSAESFERHYGVGGKDGDGDVFREDNFLEFRKFVLSNTEGQAGIIFVHLAEDPRFGNVT